MRGSDPGTKMGMRITGTKLRVLRDEARKAFGADSKVFLFGSRHVWMMLGEV